ncbi:hypothetical protein COLO4_13580 [Corchorus olitorius]|uniref:Uncharacterized protein n=1 Tax=Corchorus olitorius TaxID=93759 RepID=A0A1R3JVV7_9ROSI|nr:hypothetical protein COLO4_13580 [Corchorus olitorius]
MAAAHHHRSPSSEKAQKTPNFSFSFSSFDPSDYIF